ncbi:MAG: tyrosine recombinase XerC [Eubacteriales bacterium]|nr:tyrosine recombinase XerC [Eubacteriales bacterium]
MISGFDDIPAFLNDFFNYLETIKGKSKNTIKSYYYDLRVFLRFLKLHKNLVPRDADFEQIEITDVNIDLINTVTITDLYSYLSFVSRSRDNIASSRARKVASIRTLFNYLYSKLKVLDSNPAAELESPKILKSLPRYLNVSESKNLLSSIDGKFYYRDYAMITLFLNCGMRLSELVNINISDIRNSILTLIGKGNKERAIPLNKACISAIEEYLKVRPVDGVKDKNALFLSSRNQRISNNMVHRIVKKYLSEAGLDPKKYSTHKLRHTAATLMYKHGHVDIRALQELLGHESIATTEIYTHLDKQQLKDAVDSNPLSDFSAEHSAEHSTEHS